MDFSVIIPTYKRPDTLSRTVNSITSFDVNLEFEIIIVNDCPGDDIGSFNDKRIRVIENEKNLGRSASRNRGASEAASAVLFFIDDDIEVTADLFSKHLELLDNGYDAVYSNVINIRSDGIKSALNKFLNTRGAVRVPEGSDIPSNYFTSAFCSLKKAFFDKIGRFDESFQGYGWEDPELGMRIKAEEGRTGFVRTDALIHYHDKDIREWADQIVNAGKNLRYLLKKHPLFAVKIRLNMLRSPIASFIFNSVFFRMGIRKAELFGNLYRGLFFKYIFYGAVSRSLKK